ncbi:MAG: hypothetical protein KBD31_02475 [Proteobacteria bacterium]|nr:hypothetical protein [Pseudomonadota bacterium]
MKKVLLLSVSALVLTSHLKASFFDGILNQAKSYVEQNQDIQNAIKFGKQQVGNVLQQQLTGAQGYINQNGGMQNLQNGIQNAYNSGGIDGAFNQVTQDVRNLAPGLINSAQTLAQQQQGQLQSAYTKDQMNQVVSAMTQMDQQYGTQVQSINPAWRQAYAQAQVNLYNAPGNSPVGKTYIELCQRMIQAIPVLIKNKGSLNPSDATWQQLMDNNGNLYKLDGTPLQPVQAPISLIGGNPGASGGSSLINMNPTPQQNTNLIPNQQQQAVTLTPAQIASGIQTAVAGLRKIDQQYGAQLAQYAAGFANSPFAQIQGVTAAVFTAYKTTLAALQAPTAATDPNVSANITLANNQIKAIPTLVMAEGALCPTDATWSKLTDGMGGYYDLLGNTLYS